MVNSSGAQCDAGRTGRRAQGRVDLGLIRRYGVLAAAGEEHGRRSQARDRRLQAWPCLYIAGICRDPIASLMPPSLRVLTLVALIGLAPFLAACRHGPPQAAAPPPKGPG